MKRAYSLRIRMMLWFTALAGSLLAGTCLAFYGILNRVLTAQFDQRLLAAAEPVRLDLIPDPAEDDLSQLNGPGENDVNKLDMPGEYFELLDEAGRVVQQSKNLAGRSLRLERPPRRITRPVFGVNHDFRQGTLRWVLIPLQRGTAKRLLLLAMPTVEIDRTLADFRRIIALLLPAALLLTAAVSVWYVSRSLRPIDELTRHAAAMAQSIGDAATALWTPLPAAGGDDELGRLAATFNGLFERIDTAVRQLRQFVTDAAHELRTPLSVLQGETELILSAPRAAAEYRKSLECVDEELKNLSCIVKNLFTLSIADAGQLTLAFELLDLNEVLEQSCALAVPLARAKDIRIMRSLERQVPFCGDEAVLRQLFLIFLENAVKYSPAGTSIDVDLAVSDGQARARIVDQGVGVAPEHLPHIFERFYRVPNVSQADGGGLGLAIAQALARTHGGTIECGSTLGEGSTFTVRLPLRKFAYTPKPA